MKINELKFQNLPQEDEIKKKWEKLPDNYKDYFLTKGRQNLSKWILGSFVTRIDITNNRPIPTKMTDELGMTFKLLNYLVAPKNIKRNKFMYRAIRIEDRKHEFYKNIETKIKTIEVYPMTTGYTKYQSWTTSYKNSKDFVIDKFGSTYKYAIFKAPINNVVCYIPDLSVQLKQLHPIIKGDDNISYIDRMIRTIDSFINEKEIIVKSDNGRILISDIKIF